MSRQDLIDYIAAATAFYGVISMEKIGQLFEGHTGIGFSRGNVRKFAEMEEAALIARFAVPRGNWFVYESIDDSGELETYLDRTHGKRYYVPEKDEMLRYGDQFYIPMTEEVQALQAFLTDQLGADEELAEDILLSVKDAANDPERGLFENLVRGLDLGRFEEHSEEELDQYITLGAAVFNRSRSWLHRGKTPIEAGEPLQLPDAHQPVPMKVQSEWIRYIRALVRLYGAVPATKVAEIYNEQNHAEVQPSELLNLTHVTLPAALLIDSRIVVREGKFMDALLQNGNRLAELEADASGKPYYVPERRQLLRWAEENYYEPTPQAEALRTYARRHLFKKVFQVDYWMNFAHRLILINKPPAQAFSSLLEHGQIVPKDEQEIRKLADLFFDLYNHGRSWANRGHTPQEIKKERPTHVRAGSRVSDAGPSNSVKTVEKVGRNEPCPCGSGKKYKKCCGR